MKKERIMLVQHYGKLSGSIIGLCNTIKMLSQDGFEVIVLVAECSPEVENRMKECGARVIEHYSGVFFTISYFSGGPRIFSRTFLRPFFSYKKSVNFVMKMCDKYHPDMIIFNSMVLAWGATLNNKTKKICHVRETLPCKSSFWGRILIKLINKMDGVMFISEYDKNIWGLGCHTEVVRDAVSFNFNKSHEIDLCQRKESDLRVVYVGGSNPIKGFNVFYQVIELIPSNRIEFIIAGRLSEEDKRSIDLLNNKLRIRGSNNHVTVIGEVDNIDCLFESVDVLVCPSTSPHQLRPIFEAGAHKIPVITTDYEVISEYLKNGYNGLTFSENDIEGLIRDLMYLVSHEDERRRIGNNNYENTLKKHSFESVRVRLVHFVDKVLSE